MTSDDFLKAVSAEFQKVSKEHTNMKNSFGAVTSQHDEMLTALKKVEKQHDAMSNDLAELKSMLQQLLSK